MKSLAVKYRPTTFNDVIEQSSTITILRQQLASGEIQHAYLFCGGAGTGKTTCARIFANALNQNQGKPIEMDAASNSSVDDVREIIKQAKTLSLSTFYKVFIIDECHSLSNTAWQALLKLLEEPPAKAVFIFCTTDPQKIPKTILSRIQRYDFQRISYEGIVDRLVYICEEEGTVYGGQYENCDDVNDALRYIAKMADGGMRDAITLLDKCLSYTNNLTLQSVVDAIGTINYDELFQFTNMILHKDIAGAITFVETVHRQGKELKQFCKTYMMFLLDVCKFAILKNSDFIEIPAVYCDTLSTYLEHKETIKTLLNRFVKLNADIKWDSYPKALIEATLVECMR